MTTVVVLGSSGFVGRHLVRHFRPHCSTIGVSRSSGPDTDVQADLTEASSWADLPSEAQVVINAAGLVGRQSAAGAERQATLANAYLPMAAAQYADRIGAHLVHLSSAGVYGFSGSARTEQAATEPTDIYCITKRQGELACGVISDPARLAVLRLSFPYGPEQVSGLVPGLSARIQAGEPVSLNTEDGSPRISPLFIDDCCAAVGAVIAQRVSGTFNLGGNQQVSIRELAEAIAATLGCAATFELSGQPCEDLVIDSSALQTQANWQPAVSLQQGLQRTLEHHTQ